jgi:hypothetical protein
MMKKSILILACLACSSVWAVDTAKNTGSTETNKSTAQQEPAKKEVPSKKPASKKQAGKMEKAGNSVKSGWNKFTHDVKQGAEKPACTPAQRSMNQCK